MDVCGGAAGVPQAQAGSRRLWLEQVPTDGGADCTPHPSLIGPPFPLSAAAVRERTHGAPHGRAGSRFPLLVLATGTARIIRPVCTLR